MGNNIDAIILFERAKYMELKGREIISLPILDESSGKDLGEVKNLIYDLHNKKLTALIIEDGGWLWGKNIIYLKDIETIGKDVVIILSADIIICTAQDSEAKKLTRDFYDLIGNKVITQSGKDLGIIEDIIFEVDTGEITGLEISNGILADLIDGRSEIAFPQDIVLGDQSIIVGESIVNRQ